jgi:predicted house-cleaning NTP pyrophosphatase (Maf/HAM1 superfamily)
MPLVPPVMSARLPLSLSTVLASNSSRRVELLMWIAAPSKGCSHNFSAANAETGGPWNQKL